LPLLRKLRNALAFLTIIPVGMDEKVFDDAADVMWLFPLYGALIGLVSGLVGLALESLRAPSIVWATMVYASLLIVTGFNHMDGLLDFADAAVAQAPKERRLEIMKDQYTGAAAVSTGLAVALVTVASLSSLSRGVLVQAVVVSEAVAKLGMVISAFMGPPARKGLGELFINRLRGKWRAAKLATSASVCLALSWLLGLVGVVACLAGSLASTAIVGVARRKFGGLTGDVMGAVNEISRGAALVAIAVSLRWGLRA
jgi:adenosylcobinamide-GDP ribazoletransferase